MAAAPLPGTPEYNQLYGIVPGLSSGTYVNPETGQGYAGDYDPSNPYGGAVGLNQATLQRLGFTGQVYDTSSNGGGQDGNPAPTLTPEFINWMKANGYHTTVTTQGSTQYTNIVDSKGNTLAQTGQDLDANGELLKAGIVVGGGAAAGYGALAAAGAGAGAGATGAGLADVSGMDLAADAGAGANSITGAGAALGPGTAAAPIATGATNPALIDSAAGTPGFGTSSAGVGGGSGTLANGAAAGGTVATTAPTAAGTTPLANWTQLGSSLYGAYTQAAAANAANANAQAATTNANNLATSQLGFTQQVYNDQKPYIDQLNQQAIDTGNLDAQIAAQSADRSQTAWEQNQQATQASVSQMGLNALGAQYLDPDQTAQLQQLQKTMATGTPDEKAAAQTQIAALQKTAESNAIGLEHAKGVNLVNDASGQAKQVVDLGESNAQSILGDSGTIQGDLNSMGDARRADQTGFYNTQAQTTRDVAAQRAKDNELRATTQTNADIANSADQAQRELLRLGGDPNKMAAMSADISNSQQLARIGSGNQVAATNIANLNAADDTARGLEQTGFNAGTAQQYGLQDQAESVKSSALDAARASRTTAQQTAQGINFGAQNSATALDNNAKDKVDANMNAGLQGVANYGAGFANTSGQAAMNAVSAGTAGINGQNTAINSSNGLVANTNNAMGQVNGAANAAVGAVNPSIAAGNSQAQAIGQIGATLGSIFASSKKVKKNRQDMDHDAVLDGLEAAAPQSYDYKAGQGPQGRKVGAMAEDMHKQFGDAVAPGGKGIDVQNMIGLEHAAIVALSRRVKQLEHRGARHG